MFSRIDKLERLLTKFSSALENSETKRYTANQMLKAENINLAEGASLTINMNNMICTQEIVLECLEIVKEVKPYLPMKNGHNLNQCLNHYKNTLITKALQESEGNQAKAAKLLSLTKRQIRYEITKRREL